MMFTQRWGTFRNGLVQLAVTMDLYAEFLESFNDKQVKRQKLDYPTRQLGQYAEPQQRDEADTVHHKYVRLDSFV